jgi:exodeoxyribonuclease VII large subunit
MALSAKKVPLISAIGHEIDTTLVDYLADVRASTPTAAAELVVPDQNELRQTLTDYSVRLENAINTLFLQRDKELKLLTTRPVLVNFGAIVDNLTTKLLTLSTKLGARSAENIARTEITLHTLKERLNKALTRSVNAINELLVAKSTRLEALNPTNILQRGYAFISKEETIIKSAQSLKAQDEIKITFSDGSILAEVKGGADE